MNLPRSQSSELLEQLSRNSTPYNDPLRRVNWDELNHSMFWLPAEAISLHGLPAFEALPQQQQRALSQFEFLNFIEAGLWLESIFVERLSRALRGRRQHLPRLIYRLHELREETGHSLLFLELLRRSGPLLPNTRFHRLNLANLVGRYAPFESTGFWAAVIIGEEVPDRLNRVIRKHRADVCPAVYDIVSIHVMDEARHIAHARETLEERLTHLARWQKRLLQPVLNVVFRQFVEAYYFPPPRVYELAGLSPGAEWAKLARQNPRRLEFVKECLQSSLRPLRQHGILLTWE